MWNISDSSCSCIKYFELLKGQEPSIAITDTKLYVLVVILSTQNNAKLLKQLKSGLKRTIKWNKCQSKVAILALNKYWN